MPSSHPPPVLSIHVYTDPEDQMKRSFILDIVYALRDDLFIHGKKSLKADTLSETDLLLRAALKVL